MKTREKASLELFRTLNKVTLIRLHALCDGEFLGKFFEKYPELSEEERTEIVDNLYDYYNGKISVSVWVRYEEDETKREIKELIQKFYVFIGIVGAENFSELFGFASEEKKIFLKLLEEAREVAN